VLDRRLKYLVNDTVTFACDKGYKLQGQKELVCQENREWNGAMPRCIGKQVVIYIIGIPVHILLFN